MTIESFMVRDDIQEFIKEIKAYDSIRLDEIPEYRLFISQIEEFFDKKLGKNTDDDEDRKTISKTMIQNYIKDGLIMPPEGKSYNRNHIILLALIYNLKPILTIRDIKKLLLPILEMADDDSQTNKIESMYSTYFALKESYLDEFINLIEHDLKIMDEKLNEEYNGEWQKIPKILLVLMLITQANIRKRLAERIIELYFNTEES
ncbi:MAG: DUF1836 domain-containing protein [Caldicoprobacterales bacterium]|jgi:hypothetical protein|nr:DUF1836 domain-containing protein [Clostridiales bacterium]